MLKQKALSATLWSAADIFLRQGLTFIISIALARLLTPEEFGTIALLYLFIGIGTVFVDSGFSSALIQKQDTTHTDESTVFWFNLGMGALVAMLLWQSAPLIAAFYDIPILVPLTKILAVNVFIAALGAMHRTLLTKRLDFKTQMKIGATATVVSGTLAIILALRGFGVWALAVQTIAATATGTLLLWMFSHWRPASVFSLHSARRLFSFGGYLLASSLLDTTYQRFYTLLIGKFYGVRELGFYNRADGTKQLPAGVLTGILSRVAFPIFSAAAEDKARLHRGVRLALRGIMLINIPMMLGMAAAAEPLVLTLFGEQWRPAVPILQVLCLGVVLWPLQVINLNVLMAQGHSNLFFRLEVIKKMLGMGFLVIGTLFGVMGIAWSRVVFTGVAFLINAHYTRRYLGYGALDQTRDFLPALGIAVPMTLLVTWLQPMLDLPSLPKLLVLTAIGVVFYGAASFVFRLSALRDCLQLLQSRRTKNPLSAVT